MIVIADSGSTKTSWCLFDTEQFSTEFSTEGYNPCYMDKDYISRSIQENIPPGFKWSKVKKVVFYGAGCYENKYSIMQTAMQPAFPQAQIEIAMDLIGAARSLLMNRKGFAAILGTGTNTCLYDGKHINQNIDSLGFILGDEGSGGYIGKRLISDYIRGYMPEDIQKEFWIEYNMTPDELIDRIYTGEMPNRFCAGFCCFITSRGSRSEYLDRVVRDSFRAFFRNIVCGYPNYTDYTFNCVGSIGWIFKDILAEVANEFQMSIGKIIRNPMEGLVEYHRLYDIT